MEKLKYYQTVFQSFLEDNVITEQPKNLYDPVNYILGLGGKRIRPTLTLMGADVFGGTVENALNAAMAVEVFHNFSLVHDDIMDAAPLRRGSETVHTKWDINTGILSGDAMLILAYQYLERYDSELFKPLVKLFSKTAREVCEGQQYDVDFETRSDVTIPEYLHMIEYKTAVLVGCAFQMGAMIAGVPVEDQQKIYEFGRLLGVAFQLQDDYLDAFGDPKKFGKQVGGDIIENKKTYLYLKALELGNLEESFSLERLFQEKAIGDNTEKISKAKVIFNSSGSAAATQDAIKQYTEEAFAIANELNVSEENKQLLLGFGTYLMNRRV